MARIYADFQNLDNENRLRLGCAGTLEDLARHHIQLREGLVLTFYMDDADDDGKSNELLAEGTVHFKAEAARWVAAVEWSALKEEITRRVFERRRDARETAEKLSAVVARGQAE